MREKIKILMLVGIISFSGIIQADLVAYYPFEGNASDVSGYENHGTSNGGVEYVSGVVGNALKLNGVNSEGGTRNPDFIRVPNSSSLQFGSQFTISYWVKIDGNKRQTGANCSGDAVEGISGTVIAKSGDRNGFYISESDVATGMGINPYNGGKGNSAGDLLSALGEFRFVSYTINNNLINIYVDGELKSSEIGVVDFSRANNEDLFIGVSNNAQGSCLTYWYPLDGVIDELRIYNHTLSESEIQELYNEGSAPNEEEPVATPEVYINTNSQSIFKGETLQVFFNTSVLAGMSDKYKVYLSINWDDETVYDNGIELVADKQPLFDNIVVPELLAWFEYERLRYTFNIDAPRTDYILGLHLVDDQDNVVFESFSSVSYFPEEPPFSSTGKSWKQPKTVSSFKRQSKSSSKKCHLGGIRTDLENATAKELDKATRRSMLALQMGSSFMLEGQLKTLYQRRYHGVKSAYNLLKKGKKVCDYVNHFETELDTYDENMKNDLLTSEQASDLFAIELLTSALSLTRGGGFLYSGFDSNDLVNGVKDYYNYRNKHFSDIAAIGNSADAILISFDQPNHHWFFNTKPVKLKVTVTPVFTYEDKYESTNLRDIPKNFTNSDNIEAQSIYLGEADSNRTSFGNIDYRLKTTLPRGLYLIKAATEDDTEVFRDTIHVTSKGQEFTMIIDR